ncbi:MAG: ABC transporter permease [Clostridia bacterium]|nr:ABC transporter permease [Butyrivibrio sp.]MBQ7548048.1 ABC transporter permease [Clostridia bacterium]
MTDSGKNNAREPFVRIIKRGLPSTKRALAVRALSLAAALVICSIFILIVGKGEVSIGKAFSQMWNGTFGIPGNERSMRIMIWDTAIYAAKLLCISVALAPAFKMKFWNIGAEGQIIMGGLATAIIMHDFGGSLPKPLLLTLMIVVCVICGAIWGIIPAVFKAYWGTNETLFTLMMNYVAMKIMDYFYNMWKGKLSALPTFPKETWFPSLFEHSYGWNIVIFVLLAVLMFFYLKKTKQGYEIAVVGDSANTARYAGINVRKVIIRTMAISGAICGLCGGLTVAAQNHNIAYSAEAVHTVTTGYGFTAIIVAWLANFNTLGMILIAVLIQFLEKGTGQLGNSFPAFAVGAGNVMIGIVLFCIIGGAFFLNYKLVFRKRSAKEAKQGKEREGDA